MWCINSQSQSQSHKLRIESLNLNLSFKKLLSSVSAMQEDLTISPFIGFSFCTVSRGMQSEQSFIEQIDGTHIGWAIIGVLNAAPTSSIAGRGGVVIVRRVRRVSRVPWVLVVAAALVVGVYGSSLLLLLLLLDAHPPHRLVQGGVRLARAPRGTSTWRRCACLSPFEIVDTFMVNVALIQISYFWWSQRGVSVRCVVKVYKHIEDYLSR